MVKQRVYEYQGQSFPAMITFKRMRSLTLRYDHEKGELRVSVPTLTPMRKVDEFVEKYLPKVVKRTQRKKQVYEDGYLYVFGERKEVGELLPEEITAFYKKVGLPFVKDRVAHYSALMGIDFPYRVRMREMKRTFGSNSRKTKTLTFQTRLMAFAPAIIDSVVVHELAHHFHFDHSPAFYSAVYAYCPDYDKLRKSLIHDRFEG